MQRGREERRIEGRLPGIFVDSTGGYVDFNFILEMSFLISEDLLNFTCNYCCVAFIKVCFWQ